MRRESGEIRVIRRGAAGYPDRLNDLPNMPEVLYAKGMLPDEARSAPSVAVVGARLCDQYGHRTAYEFGKTLEENGVQAISGMALGIDTHALEGALDGGGDAFAVLGSGPDVCYPRSNRALYDRLVGQGGVLSEFEPGTPAAAWHFPVRNRIISALADLILVVQAKRRSGSLITADCALEQGKAVYAVPGRVGDLLSEGCHYLIAQGAGIACSPEMLLSELEILCGRWDRRKASGSGADGSAREILPAALTPGAVRLYACLSDDPAGIDQLCRAGGLTAQEAASAASELLLAGLAAEIAPHYYAKAMKRP